MRKDVIKYRQTYTQLCRYCNTIVILCNTDNGLRVSISHHTGSHHAPLTWESIRVGLMSEPRNIWRYFSNFSFSIWIGARTGSEVFILFLTVNLCDLFLKGRFSQYIFSIYFNLIIFISRYKNWASRSD